MDCTYKINRYKMPLLEIIGITSFNTSFYSCFVFLSKERCEDYEWALGIGKQGETKNNSKEKTFYEV
ncbi:MULE transposase domain [Dillenia turbinata]|uniref:MULE transposase domain n=1 Tax=Dillenia turbinata TaxID=194707 RepID=A0AAN8VVQ5_9MAGN